MSHKNKKSSNKLKRTWKMLNIHIKRCFDCCWIVVSWWRALQPSLHSNNQGFIINAFAWCIWPLSQPFISPLSQHAEQRSAAHSQSQAPEGFTPSKTTSGRAWFEFEAEYRRYDRDQHAVKFSTLHPDLVSPVDLHHKAALELNHNVPKASSSLYSR